MRKVDDSVMIVKDTKRELFTSVTSEIFGNKYFPFLDVKQEEL